jgi:hypothetical protein
MIYTHNGTPPMIDWDNPDVIIVANIDGWSVRTAYPYGNGNTWGIWRWIPSTLEAATNQAMKGSK